MSNPELLYDVINDFIRENPMQVIELLGVFELIKIEQLEITEEDINDEELN